jgi:parallel beta-helix repeat protein
MPETSGVRLVLVLCLLLWTMAARAETYYIATNGRPDTEGSSERPFSSLAIALQKVGGGHTFLFKPGFYTGQIAIPKRYEGTAERPTILKSEQKWQATLLGSADSGIFARGCNWIVIDGFEVMGARAYGIFLEGDHCVVRNCWVHNNVAVGIGMHKADAGLIERNLIEFNGCHPQFHHGIYASGKNILIRSNIVRHNAGFGMHCYPDMAQSRIESNLICGHSNRFAVLIYAPKGGGQNKILNNTIVSNQGGVSLRNGDSEIVANNIFAANRDDLKLVPEKSKALIDYNLTYPKSAAQGPNGISANPQFQDASRGLYWLRSDSPALQKGAPRFAAEKDFWGRPLRSKPGLGAFGDAPQNAKRWQPAALNLSVQNKDWPYFFALNTTVPMIDPWDGTP